METSYKVVLIGGSSVGKSSIFKRFMTGGYSDKGQVTMSASFLEKVVPVAGIDQPIRIQLWDTAGSERFKTLNRIYYRDAVAALVVYDITKKETLQKEADHWIKDLKENAPSNVIIGLAGNKSDLFKKHEVSLAELNSFANKHSISLFNETSAKKDQGINEIF